MGIILLSIWSQLFHRTVFICHLFIVIAWLIAVTSVSSIKWSKHINWLFIQLYELLDKAGSTHRFVNPELLESLKLLKGGHMVPQPLNLLPIIRMLRQTSQYIVNSKFDFIIWCQVESRFMQSSLNRMDLKNLSL